MRIHGVCLTYRNFHQQVISKSASASSKTKTAGWVKACKTARQNVDAGKKGQDFQAIGGKTKKGKDLLAEARKAYGKKKK